MRCGGSNVRRDQRDMTSLYKISEGHHDTSHIDSVSSRDEKIASVSELVCSEILHCFGVLKCSDKR